MKLVELLAACVKEWDESTQYIYQNGNDTVLCVRRGVPTYKEDWDEWDVSPESVVLNYGDSIYGAEIGLSSDYTEALIDRAQWQAQRDRQKGGEWKRHRGGKQPVENRVRVECKLRCGDIQQGASDDFIWPHADCDVAANIMKFRVISQPQAEEVDAKRNAAKDVDVEYAFGTPDADMSNLDWKPVGKYKVSNIEFDSAETEEERVKDTTVGALTYKVEIDTGPAMQALNELSAKWDQVETPFKWRDEVTELNAYIEKFTRERAALINRLALEGFALIPAMTAVAGIAPFSLPYSEWKIGDLVTSKTNYNEQFTQGKQYKLTRIYEQHGANRISIESDDKGAGNGWIARNFEFHSRP